MRPIKHKLGLKTVIQTIKWKYPSSRQFSTKGMRAYAGHYLLLYRSTPLPHNIGGFTKFLEATINLKDIMREQDEASTGSQLRRTTGGPRLIKLP